MPVKKIPATQIEIGMYIAKLDRPWIETPFLFQGFEVQSQEDIDELHRQTQFVYILEPDEEIDIKRLASDHTGLLHNDQALNKTSYVNSSSADEEISQARKSHRKLSHLLRDIRSILKRGGVLHLKSFEQPVKHMVSSIVKNPDAYLWLSRLRKFDSFIYKDSLTTAVLATAMGRRLGLSGEAMQTLATGCMMMDVGKLLLPVELLHKPSRLNHEEWELMKTHVRLGLDLLEASPDCSEDILNIVRTHHERIDGCGYPTGLHTSQIPLFGQIAGIVDQYVAVTSPRPFAKTLSPSQAEQMLYQQRGRHFDEMLVEYFIQTICTYPTGSLVELSSGEVAIVKAQNSRLHLKPDVILLLNTKKVAYGNYPVASLDNYKKDNSAVSIERTLADGEYGIRIEELSL